MNQMMAAGAIKMESDGTVTLVSQGGTENVMGNADEN
jgi:hypothetical protein